MASLGYNNLYGVNGVPANINGFDLTVINGLSAGSIIAYERENLVVGTGLANEMNSIEVLDMSKLDLSDNVRFKMLYSLGAAVVVPEDVVYHIA